MTLMNTYRKFSMIFQFLCIGVTFGLVLWCILNHIQNDDIAKISFRNYGEHDESIYPDIHLCFRNFPDEEVLVEMRTNESDYLNFIRGAIQNEKLARIDYDKVSLQLEDHIIIKKLVSVNDSIDLNQITSFGTSFFKCFSFSVPSMKKVKHLYIGMNNTVFKSGKRSSSNFMLGLHYPNQLLRSSQFTQEYWPNRRKNPIKSYIIELRVKGVEILKRRNKSQTLCLDGEKYDDMILNEMVQAVNCSPPYWKNKMMSKLPICSSKANLKILHDRLFAAMINGRNEKISPPCTEIQSISREISEIDLEIDVNSNGLNEDDYMDETNLINEAWIDKGARSILN